MARTIKELALEALVIQNASNLSGLVHGWSRAIQELRENFPNASTEEINRHPINQLWADKLVDLAGVRSFDAYSLAHDSCENMAGR